MYLKYICTNIFLFVFDIVLSAMNMLVLPDNLNCIISYFILYLANTFLVDIIDTQHCISLICAMCSFDIYSNTIIVIVLTNTSIISHNYYFLLCENI